MNLDLADIPWGDIKPHSLVVTRLEGERLDQFVYALRDHVDPSVKVAPMHPDTEVFVVSEEDLNGLGWFRKP